MSGNGMDDTDPTHPLSGAEEDVGTDDDGVTDSKERPAGTDSDLIQDRSHELLD